MVRTRTQIIWESCSCRNRALWGSIWHEARNSADTPVSTRRRWCNHSPRKTTLGRELFTERRSTTLRFQKEINTNKCTRLLYLGYMLVNHGRVELIWSSDSQWVKTNKEKRSLLKSETTVAIPATLPARCTHPLWRRGGCLLKQKHLHSTA